MVEHGDSLRMRKQAQGGCVAMLERERKIAIRLLITGSGVQIPYNPLSLSVSLNKVDKFLTNGNHFASSKLAVTRLAPEPNVI